LKVDIFTLISFTVLKTKYVRDYQDLRYNRWQSWRRVYFQLILNQCKNTQNDKHALTVCKLYICIIYLYSFVFFWLKWWHWLCTNASL
jgi:hypothetical protein